MNQLRVDPKPKFALSPYLYMQFMEPLGTTDGSVAAAWDHAKHEWRADVLEATRALSPTMMRWGGCFSSYYRWREAVGPRSRRKPMLNVLWGGSESNQVGTDEFLDFCQQVDAEPLLNVNFESDGRRRWARPAPGLQRSAGPAEAAAWVDYCNNPRNALRRINKVPQRRVEWWQIGNETSYDKQGFDCDTAVRRTVAFAKAMRQADPDIKLIAWGDSAWAAKMLEGAGEYLDCLAFHHMFDPCRDLKDSPLRDNNYRRDPERTWEHLMNAYKVHDQRIRWMREQLGKSTIPLALTECHFSLPGRNRCDVLASWAAGVANARLLNVHQRHGDALKIATIADFCGTRWQVNALMIPTPRGRTYLNPAACVMNLFRHHQGRAAVDVSGPAELDIVASRTGRRVFLHVINTCRSKSITGKLSVAGAVIRSGRVFEIAAEPETEIMETQPDVFRAVEHPLPQSGTWTFAAASVSAIELVF